MKSKYITPEIEVTVFEKKDVVKASGGDGDNSYLNVNSFFSLDDFFKS